MQSNNNNTLATNAIHVSAITLVGFVINFGSQILIASLFGATAQRDALFLAISFIAFINLSLAGSFGTVFLPHLSRAQVELREDRFLKSILAIFTVIMSLVMLIIISNSNSIVNLLAPTADERLQSLTSSLIVILAPTILFGTVNTLLSSVYHIQQRFIIPAIVPIINVVVMIIIIFFGNKYYGINSAAYGASTGAVIGFIILVPIINQPLSIFRLNYSELIGEAKPFLIASLPLFLFSMISKYGNVYEKIIAANFGEGCVSYIGYSAQISMIITSLIATGIGTIAYPKFASLWNQKEKINISILVQKTMRIFVIISIPIVIYFWFYADIIISILFERGFFTTQTTIGVSSVIVWYMMAMVVRVQTSITSKIFIISNSTLILSCISIVELIVFIIMVQVMTLYHSYIGIGMSWFISNAVNFILSMLLIPILGIEVRVKSLIILLVRISFTIFTILMVTQYVFQIDPRRGGGWLISHIVIVMVIYLFIGIIFNNAEARESYSRIKMNIMRKYE